MCGIAGNVITASAGVITAVIGAGVLSLAWCSAQLGWVGGIVTQLLFAVITLYTSFMLCDKLRFPHPTEGERTYTYPGAVRLYLGKHSQLISLILHIWKFFTRDQHWPTLCLLYSDTFNDIFSQ